MMVPRELKRPVHLCISGISRRDSNPPPIPQILRGIVRGTSAIILYPFAYGPEFVSYFASKLFTPVSALNSHFASGFKSARERPSTRNRNSVS